MKSQKRLINLIIPSSLLVVVGLAASNFIQKSEQNNLVSEKLSSSPNITAPVVKGEVQQNWVQAAQNEILAQQYFFRSNDGESFSVVNKSQNIFAAMTAKSMTLSNNHNSNNWDVTFNLNSISAGKSELPSGELRNIDFNKERIAYHFENYTIEYFNTQEGIRQNFILNSFPAGEQTASVNISLDSKLNAHLIKNNLIFTHNSVQMLSYSDLKVWDKNGKSLKAQMHLQNDQLAIEVDMKNAVLPVTIDPISSSYAWKIIGGQDNAGLGFWICGRGDLNGDGFSDVAVGAPNYTNTFSFEGALFIYYGSAAGLSTTPDWAQYGGKENSSFGRCVSIEGDVNGDGFDDVIVGASEYDNPSKDEGKAWLYLGSASGVGTSPVWEYESNRKAAKFADAVSIVGDLNNDGYDEVVIGAKAWDDDEVLGAIVDSLGNKAGKFWVFNGTATGLNPTPAMECVGNTTDANLGVSVDAAGDVNGDGYGDINIGGYIFLIGDGMICTFHGGPGGCDDIPDFMAVGGAEDTSFFAVNLSNAGDLNGDGYSDVVIGMPRYDTYGVYNAGKLQIHYGSDTGLTAPIYELFGEGQYNERWGFNVNDCGDQNQDGYDDLLVTAKNFIPEGGGPADSVGKTYLFLGGPNGISTTPIWSYEGESKSAVGANAAAAGDVNGDGINDILLSSDAYSDGIIGQGAAYLFYGIEQVCDPVQNVVSLGVGPTVATISWDWLYGTKLYKIYVKKLGSAGAPIVINSSQNSVTITGLDPASSYRVYVKAQCQAGWTDRSNPLILQTPPMKELTQEAEEVVMYPNPVSNILNISTGFITGDVSITIFDAKGKIMMENKYEIEGSQKIALYEVANLPEGIYFVEITNGTDKVIKKISKSK